jgi:predicted ATPase
VSVFLNKAYRKGRKRETNLSSSILEHLCTAVRRRGNAKGMARIRVTVDPNAPCFQMGNRQHMTDEKSMSLQNMYEGAGFDVVPLPHEGRNRRTVERII